MNTKELNELMQGCRTYRRFLQEPVEEAVIREMLENARIASSARNDQPLYYYAVTSPEKVRAMQPLVKWAASLPPELGTPKAGEQPTAFLVMVKKAGANAFSDVDVGIAMHTLALTAWSHGIGSCMMGAINIPEIRKLFDVPEEDQIRLVLALGKPSHTSTVVPVGPDGSTDYYLDEARNYYVPKRAFEDIVRFV
jgi:nitroreductase